MTTSDLAACARNVAIAYGPRTVLCDVDFDLRRGRVAALIGPSGCGKSSFLTSLNRLTDLVPGCRVSGSLVLGDGVNVLARDANLIELRRRVGMVFQRPNPFPLSIRTNLHLPLRERGTNKRADREQVVERVLRAVGLWDEVRDRLDSSALALSGGQQQRLCIARALSLEPEILLMDEPCSALDPIAAAVIEDLIHELRGRYTLLVVTHNLAQAARIADDVAVFWTQDGCGRLIEAGTRNEVFDAPKHPDTKAYLRGDRG